VGVRELYCAKSFGDDFTVYLMDDTPKIISEAFASPDADD